MGMLSLGDMNSVPTAKQLPNVPVPQDSATVVTPSATVQSTVLSDGSTVMIGVVSTASGNRVAVTI